MHPSAKQYRVRYSVRNLNSRGSSDRIAHKRSFTDVEDVRATRDQKGKFVMCFVRDRFSEAISKR